MFCNNLISQYTDFRASRRLIIFCNVNLKIRAERALSLTYIFSSNFSEFVLLNAMSTGDKKVKY